MAKRGIAQVTGPKSIKLGETVRYRVSKIYSREDDAKVSQARWKLYVKENNGFRELRPVAGTPPKIGSETTITITNQQFLGKELLLEAYLYAPEVSSPPGILINVEEGAKKIERVDLFRTDDTPIGKGGVVKYGQSIIVKVITLNMPNEEVEITLYEDDESGAGHHVNNEKNKVASVTKRLDRDGFATHIFKLPIDFKKIANAYMDGTEDKYHEYYIHVKSAQGTRASDNINVPNPDYTFPEQEIEAVEITVKAKEIGTDPIPDTGRSASIVQEEKIENLLDAYFAKKEYTKQTGEEAGTLEYTFAGNGNNTGTTSQKENIAKIILEKPAVIALKDKKQYTTLEAIKAVLTKDVYNKDEKISIKTFKLAEEFKRVNSAPLEEKLYLVATTSMLDGKEASLIIKEKDGIINGSAGAVLPVLEITEEQMEQKSRSGEVAGTEKTEFKEMIKGGMVKIPIHLRPKSDDELKQWKEKLARGKQDGTYTYTFASQTVLPNGSGDEKKRVAGIILTNAREGKRGNPKMEAGKAAFVEDVYEALTEERYAQGDTISFPLYKKEKELLYLQAKVQGEKQHDKEFLNQEGMYFEVGNGKAIIFPLLVKPENDKNGIHKKYYWADKANGHQATFNSNRKGGRKHAGRDLYTKPYTEVVAICDGIVLDISTAFADGTGAITVLHETNDGRKFIVRYGEVENDTVLVKKGDLVEQGDVIGKTGWLRSWYKSVVMGYEVYMLHFEFYTETQWYDVSIAPLSNNTFPFKRRSDLADGLSILLEGYRNTFEQSQDERVPPSTLFTSEKGKEFIKDYEKFRSNAYDDSEGYCTIVI